MKDRKVKIMVFGTFDILHKGHLNFFKQARSLSVSPYLIVSVARDVNVKRIKGFSPKNKENKRLEKIQDCTLVDEALLGRERAYLTHILAKKPAIIALGYDQKAYTKDLKSILAKKGLGVKIARLKSFKTHLYKSSLIR